MYMYTVHAHPYTRGGLAYSVHVTACLWTWATFFWKQFLICCSLVSWLKLCLWHDAVHKMTNLVNDLWKCSVRMMWSKLTVCLFPVKVQVQQLFQPTIWIVKHKSQRHCKTTSHLNNGFWHLLCRLWEKMAVGTRQQHYKTTVVEPC